MQNIIAMFGICGGICRNGTAWGVWTFFAGRSTEEDSGHANDGFEECRSESSCGVKVVGRSEG